MPARVRARRLRARRKDEALVLFGEVGLSLGDFWVMATMMDGR